MSFANLVKASARKHQTTQEEFKEFTPAEGWLNVGIEVEDGSFINISDMGIAIERLTTVRGSKTNEEWNAKASAANRIIAALQQKLKEMDEGEAISIPVLTIQLRKPGKPVEQGHQKIEDVASILGL